MSVFADANNGRLGFPTSTPCPPCLGHHKADHFDPIHLRSVVRTRMKMILVLTLPRAALCRALLSHLLLDREERLLMEAASFVIANPAAAGRLLLLAGVESISEH